MQQKPLFEVLDAMKGSDKELDLLLVGENAPIQIRNVKDVELLNSTVGIKVTTAQNYIWIDASHVSAAYQVRTDL